MLGPGVAALLLGLKVTDAPVAMRAGAFAVAAVLALGYLLALFVVARRRGIYRRGTLVSAAIATRVELKRSGARLGYRIGFAFPTPSGEVRQSQDLDALAIGAIGFAPEVGDTAFVVHDPGKPTRAYLWGFQRRSGARWTPS